MKKLISIVVILFTWIGVQSHEFWLQPKKFKYTIGEEMKVAFMVGENFEGEPWDLTKNKIEKLDLHHLAKVINLKTQVRPAEKDKLKFKFTEAGTHLLTIHTSNWMHRNSTTTLKKTGSMISLIFVPKITLWISLQRNSILAT